ncbi:MAG TPA: ABC transporter permease [Gammaproteobacteria bacterium]|jgi:phospholipid/cholesterol/gamma-HCH transport system permease protein|nr:ABC transporter permease [Gammaproteobacteria bacterium]
MQNNQQTHYDAKTKQLICRGNWDINCLSDLQALLKTIAWPATGDVTLNGEAIDRMDSAGAWLLHETRFALTKKKLTVRQEKFTPSHEQLLTLVENELTEEPVLPTVSLPPWLASLGKRTVNQLNEFQAFLAFVGRLSTEALSIVFDATRWRWSSLAMVVYRTGYEALPIIALLSFLIGIVITYQMGVQLKNYGADIYVVDLLGLSVLREFGPLLTAIMVAGRTGSAFTAQLGMMKLNQEIDALDTMGVTPGELLMLPRIIGLFIALPLLTMWSDIFGIVGGMIMANSMMNISWYDFLHRFPHVIPLRTLLIGLGKAPVFALIIASIGCFQGMRVEGSAESVGRNTTRSVVLAIFFIMAADAAFSVIFSKLKL